MIHRATAPGRPLLLWACWGLLVLASWLAGVPGAVAAQDGETNRAGLVVQFDGGRVETRCVDFQAAEITGAELLAQSGLDTIVDASSGLGITVCRIEGQGCSYPAQPCFCQCSGSGTCAYWNYLYRDPGSTGWTYAPLGALLHKVRPGSVDAWVWGNGQALPAAELSFEALCGVSAPAAAIASGAPTGRAPSAATREPVATPTPAPPAAQERETQAASEPAPGSQGAASYWLFGVMALGLVLVGTFVWLKGRRR